MPPPVQPAEQSETLSRSHAVRLQARPEASSEHDGDARTFRGGQLTVNSTGTSLHAVTVCPTDLLAAFLRLQTNHESQCNLGLG